MFTAGHGRSVLPAACLAVSRYLATAGLFDTSSVNQNWQQVETAADWISCSLPGLRRPFRGVRRVMVVPCLQWATAGLFDGTELHGTPARRDIPRKPSNQTFVAVPNLKRNTSRRPPSAPIKFDFGFDVMAVYEVS